MPGNRTEADEGTKREGKPKTGKRLNGTIHAARLGLERGKAAYFIYGGCHGSCCEGFGMDVHGAMLHVGGLF